MKVQSDKLISSRIISVIWSESLYQAAVNGLTTRESVSRVPQGCCSLRLQQVVVCLFLPWFGPSDTNVRSVAGYFASSCLTLHRWDKSPDGEVSFVNPFVRAYLFL